MVTAAPEVDSLLSFITYEVFESYSLPLWIVSNSQDLDSFCSPFLVVLPHCHQIIVEKRIRTLVPVLTSGQLSRPVPVIESRTKQI